MREIPKEPDCYDSVARYPVEVDELRNCVLLVDDSPEIRHSLRRMFEHAGWEVCGEAANGLKAIEEAARLQPQLIVLDVAMPEMNGLIAARILKRAMPKRTLDSIYHARQPDHGRRSCLCGGGCGIFED